MCIIENFVNKWNWKGTYLYFKNKHMLKLNFFLDTKIWCNVLFWWIQAITGNNWYKTTAAHALIIFWSQFQDISKLPPLMGFYVHRNYLLSKQFHLQSARLYRACMAIRAEESCSRLCQLKDVAMDTNIVRKLSLGKLMYIRCNLASLYIH